MVEYEWRLKVIPIGEDVKRAYPDQGSIVAYRIDLFQVNPIVLQPVRQVAMFSFLLGKEMVLPTREYNLTLDTGVSLETFYQALRDASELPEDFRYLLLATQPQAVMIARNENARLAKFHFVASEQDKDGEAEYYREPKWQNLLHDALELDRRMMDASL